MSALIYNNEQDKLDMSDWQQVGYPFNDFSWPLKRGEFASFSIHVAMSEEFQKAGGFVNTNGYAELDGNMGYEAMAKWFSIPSPDARLLCAFNKPAVASRFYGVPEIGDITPEKVIEKLDILSAHGTFVD